MPLQIPFIGDAYEDPLGDVARKDRRSLLALGTIALFLGLTRSIPLEISAFGIDLTGSERTIVVFFLVLILYFLVSFIHRARGDINVWKFTQNDARWDRLTALRAVVSESNEFIKLEVENPGSSPAKQAISTVKRDFEKVRRSLGEDETAMIPLDQWILDVKKKAASVHSVYRSANDDDARSRIRTSEFQELIDTFAAMATKQPSTSFYRNATSVLAWWLPIGVGVAGVLALVYLFLTVPLDEPPPPQPTGMTEGF